MLPTERRGCAPAWMAKERKMASPLLILSRIRRRMSAYCVTSCRNPAMTLGALALALFGISYATASATTVTFTQLTGGLSDAFGITTGVFKADLSALGSGQITSVTI